MRKRFNLLCGIYLTIIVCLAGVLVFVVYQQERVIENQRQAIVVLQRQGLEMGDGFTVDREVWVEYFQLPPEIMVETVYVDRPVEKIVERVIVEEKEVEIIIYKHLPIRNWESIEEFEEWYIGQNFAPIIFTVGADCDDFSVSLQRAAARQGYLVSEAIAKNGLYCGVKVTKFGAGEGGKHAGNLVMIDGVYYWVEPQPEEFNIKRLFDRD